MTVPSAIGTPGGAATIRWSPCRRTSSRSSSATSLARRVHRTSAVLCAFLFFCLSWRKLSRASPREHFRRNTSVVSTGVFHRAVCTCTGMENRRWSEPASVHVVAVVPFYFFFFFRQARWLEETGFPAHARPCRRSTFMAATVLPSWLERSSSSALRNTSQRSRRPGPTTWPPPWRRPPPWSRRGYRQR